MVRISRLWQGFLYVRLDAIRVKIRRKCHDRRITGAR
jgi:hypothetical protein